MAELVATLSTPEIADAIARGRAAWPDLRVDEAAFAAWLHERWDPTSDAALHAEDLWLACACASGDAGAIAAFHRAFDASISAAVARVRRSTIDADELRQRLDVHLFVADAGSPARITAYQGVGTLRTWVRVVATRLLLNAARRKSDHYDELTSRVERELDGGGDVEIDWLKDRYRAAFRTALTECLGELPPADRSLLRLCVVGGMSATAIAVMYQVHRATAKRWLARVRRDVLDGTRRRLRAALRVDAQELDSIMGLIGSRLEASVRRCLADDEVGGVA